MKALIKQSPAYQAEVWFESDWLPWIGDGTCMARWPYGYALCQNATSPDPMSYIIEERQIIDEYGDTVTIYIATQAVP